MFQKLMPVMLLLLLSFGCDSNPGNSLAPNDTSSDEQSGGGGGGGGGGGITTGIVKVSTGDDHSCLLTADSKVYCSGDNGDNQVAPITANYDIIKPIDLTPSFGGLTPVDISVEYDASCAIFSNGTAKCWGGNRGELGGGHTNDVVTPEDVLFFDGSSAAKKIKTFRMGEYLACALSEEDKLYCWGENREFILDSQPDLIDPTQPLIPAITAPMLMTEFDGSTPAKTVKDFRVGHLRACVLSMTDEFKCFGYIRDDNGVDVYTPTFIQMFGMDGSTAAKKVESFSLGYAHACFVTAEDKVMCWGNNSNGKLGCGIDDGTLWFSSTPCQVVNADDSDLLAQSVSAGDYQTCALTLDSKVKCWGRGTDGGIGNGLFTNQEKAQTVIKENGSDLSDIAYLNSGLEAGHVCAITSPGSLYCWGDNGDGQLMTGINNSAITPHLMPMTAVASIAKGYANDSNSCYVKTSGAVICSDNSNYTSIPLQTTPIDGTAGNHAVSLSQNNNGGCAVLTTGGLSCWDSTLTAAPVAYFNFSDADHTAQKVVKVNANTCVLANNKVRCDLDYTVVALSNVIDIAANDSDLCVIHTNNSVVCYNFGVWGTPIPVANLTGAGELATTISISNNVGCSITQSGKVLCWPFSFGGENNYGLLGDGTISAGPVNYYSANQVNIIDGIAKVAAKVEVGNEHACSQLVGGDVYCWGSNRDYQVNGSILDTTSYYVTEPTKVSNMPIGENFTLNVLGNNSCVVGNTTGAVYCWGNIYYTGLSEDLNESSKANLISL